MKQAFQNKDTWTGLVISAAVNSIISSGLCLFSGLLATGISMSSNPEAENSLANTGLFLWCCVPGVINIPAVGIAMAMKRRLFAGGWLLGSLLAALGGIVLLVAIFGFVWFMQTFVWR